MTSKLWNTKHHADDVEPALQRTLSDLGLAYLDLYLIHSPIAFKRGEETFPKTEDGKILVCMCFLLFLQCTDQMAWEAYNYKLKSLHLLQVKLEFVVV